MFRKCAAAVPRRKRSVPRCWGNADLPPSTKVLAAVETINDLHEGGEQVVVMTTYKAVARSVVETCRSLGLRAAAYTGDQSAKEREGLLAMFRAGDLDLLVGTIATMGEGVDGLQVARHIVFLDRDWTPARNEQAIARVRRSGQQADSDIEWRIVARDTVDAVIDAALESKQSVIDAFKGHKITDILSGKRDA